VTSEPDTPVSAPDWRSIVENLAGPAVVCDLAGRVVLASPATGEYAATPLDDMVGTPVWQLAEVESIAAEVEERFFAATRGEHVEPILVVRPNPDGADFVVSWHGRVLVDAEGRPTHVLLTGHDVTRQHEAETTLQERDAHFRDAFERADTVWWEWDLVSGTSTWPEAAEKFYGVSNPTGADSIERWRSVLHPDDREKDVRITQRILDEGWETFETENRIIHPEKGVRWIRTHGRVVRSPDGEPLRFVGVNTDVTERRQAEEQLRQSEAAFRTLADSLPQIVWTARADGLVDYFNRRWTEFSGISQPGGEAWGWTPVLHPDDEERTLAAWRAAIEAGEPYVVEHRIERRDGVYRWHMSSGVPVKDEHGRVTKWFGTATDVHDQKVAALDLERRSAQQSAVAELGIFALRTSELRLLMRTALERLRDLLGTDLCKVLRLRRHDGGRDLVLEAAVGFPDDWIGTVTVGADLDSQAGFTLASNEPVVVADLAAETRFGGPGLLRDLGVVSGMSVVIHGTGDPYGVLGVHGTTPLRFDAADAAFLQSVANVVAEAVKRRESAAALETRVRRLDALHTIDNAITDGREMHATLRVIVDQIRQQLEVDAVAAFVYKDDLQTLGFAAGSGFRTDFIREDAPGLGEGRLGVVALERRLDHVPDIRSSLDSFARAHLVEAEGFVTYFGVPLVVKGALEGVLEIFHREPMQPDVGWHEFLTTLGTQTAIAINSSRLFADLQVSNSKLRLAYDATIEGWARALELKDNQTEGHSRRVTDLSVRLARRLGVPDQDLVDIRRGALLHDIGKMAIPDRILLKEGRLDAAEWEVMRSHPTQAYELLLPVEFLRDALDIPYAHHERWDGSGYPRGLAGEEIPLAARIFAVADVYDALTSERPYWPAWSKERALEYVRDQSGRHFDPSVAAEFGAMMAQPKTS
jgi:PAS domain S-box-containing protein/putative nucleotidyltransferase with HDIG domain